MDVRGQLAAASINTQSRAIVATHARKPMTNAVSSSGINNAKNGDSSNHTKLPETGSHKESHSGSSSPIFIATVSKIPAEERDAEFLSLLEGNDMLFVTGNAGSGKSTTIPLCLLKYAKANGTPISMLSFQVNAPCAFSVARHCCNILGEDIGGSIGYTAHNFSKPGSALTFRPYKEGGVIDNDNSGFQQYTHLILDDVYLQADGFDQVFLCCKELIDAERSKGKGGPKLIFVSTTFGEIQDDIIDYMPGLSYASFEVHGKPAVVDTLRLEDVAALASSKIISLETPIARKINCLRNRLHKNSPEECADVVTTSASQNPSFNSQTMADAALFRELFDPNSVLEALDISYFRNIRVTLTNPDAVNFILDVVWFCCRSDFRKGSVLVFLPGAGECKRMAEKFDASRTSANDPHAWVLHSRMKYPEQVDAIDPITDSDRRVIFTTAMAETALTLPDVTFVVDCAKDIFVDYSRKEKTYHLDWVSKASHEQRKGRVGRVKPGVYIDLSHEANFDNLSPFPEPALTYVPLVDLILNLAPKTRTNFSPLKRTQALFNQPASNLVRHATMELVAFGALRPGGEPGTCIITTTGIVALRTANQAVAHERSVVEYFYRKFEEHTSDSGDTDEIDESEEDD